MLQSAEPSLEGHQGCGFWYHLLFSCHLSMSVAVQHPSVLKLLAAGLQLVFGIVQGRQKGCDFAPPLQNIGSGSPLIINQVLTLFPRQSKSEKGLPRPPTNTRKQQRNHDKTCFVKRWLLQYHHYENLVSGTPTVRISLETRSKK